jgi:hypothetical protein
MIAMIELTVLWFCCSPVGMVVVVLWCLQFICWVVQVRSKIKERFCDGASWLSGIDNIFRYVIGIFFPRIASKIARTDCPQAGKSMRDQDSNYFSSILFPKILGWPWNLLGKSNKDTREA